MDSIPIDQPVKLATPVPSFTFFAEDQVLTAEQLNRLIQYLDYQDRASRAWLTGSGIVCGLQIAPPTRGNFVEVSAGCALTSDGDLLTLGDHQTYSHLRPFADKDAKYAAFEKAPPLGELVAATDISPGDGAVPLTADSLNDAVLALYLESYVKEPDFCTSENCDNQGKIQHLTPRLLALPKAKLDPLPGSLAEIAVQLPIPAATRAKIQLGTIAKLEGADGLQSRFTTAIAITRAAIVDAAKALKKHSAALASFLDGDSLDWLDKLPAAPDPKNEVPRLQDIYAFYRDFCDAFAEWHESLFACGGECVPTIAAHPKHVFLGTPAGGESFRHPFRRAAALGGCGDGPRRSRLLWQRLRAMMDAFNGARETLDKLTIIPSACCAAPLGQRALPAYYGKGFNGPWNIDAALRADPRPPISYFTTSDARLDHHTCRENFYRIEGHLGKTVGEVQKALEALRRDHNLAFQILVIQIEDDPAFAIPRPHRFFDLETSFYNQRTKFKLQLRDVDDFAVNLQTALEDGRARIPTVAHDGVPAPDVPATTGAAGQIRAQSKTALDAMPMLLKHVTSANSANFITAYTETISQSHIVNKNIAAISGQARVNPIDRMVLPENSANWKILIDRFNKRRVKIAELSTFEKFVSANPGLEHLGGVPSGGTFVLVYSASQNEERRIVKADFCLPYYSCFDLNSLGEEEPPAEPEVATPEVKYLPPKWKDIYTWNISPVTEVAVGKLFDVKGTQLANTLGQSLTLQVDKQFTAFTNLVPLFQVKQPGVGGLTGGMEILRDPKLFELHKNIEKLTFQRDELVRQKDLGVGPDNATVRIEELEKEISVNTDRGLALVTAEAKSAGTENRAVGGDYQTFTRYLAGNASGMQSDEGRKALGTVYDKAVVGNTGNAFIANNVGRISAMLKI